VVERLIWEGEAGRLEVVALKVVVVVGGFVLTDRRAAV